MPSSSSAINRRATPPIVRPRAARRDRRERPRAKVRQNLSTTRMPAVVPVVGRRMSTIRCAAAAALAAGALGAGAAPALASSTEPVGRWDREYLAATVQGARFEIAAGHV